MQERTNPLSLQVDALEKMLNFEIHGHPIYSGLEIQCFDDDVHGRGVLMFLTRSEDERVDVYQEPGLRLDPDGYAIAAGAGEWLEVSFERARFDICDDGVDVDIGMSDRHGHVISVRIDDRDGTRRKPGSLLAPMGAAIRSPNRLPLVWMPQFDLVRTGGRLEVTIDGDPVEIGRLPISWLHRRALVKYASDLFVVSVNPSYEGSLTTLALRDVSVEQSGHQARLRLDREVVLGDVTEAAPRDGKWSLEVDGSVIIDGTWAASRVDDQVVVSMRVDHGWKPRKLPVFMRLVTTVAPVFRRWPTTYRWAARVDPTRGWMTSSWHRTDGDGADEYHKLTSASG